MSLHASHPDLGLSDDDADWYDIWSRQSGTNSSPVPDTDELTAILHRLGVDDEVTAAAVAARPDAERHPQLWWVAQRCLWQLRSTMGQTGPLKWPTLPERFGAPGRFVYLYPLLAAIPDTLEYYRRHGIDESVFWDTMGNIAEKLRLNPARFGHHGLRLALWFTLHARGTIFRLGRLEFAIEYLAADHPFDGLTAGRPTLGVHIPGDSGPMDPDSCADAIARAREFFPKHFAAVFPGPPPMTCTSWLLDPQLREILAPESNIVAFQDMFRIMPPEPDAAQRGEKDVLQFVFDRTGEYDPATLPRDSTLRRRLADGWAEGRQWLVRGGLLR